jgi:hypothetical protein
VTYLTVMFAIVLIGITLAAVGKHWKMIVQREKEADFLAKGIEIQNALALYSATMKIGRILPGEMYPHSLVELTRPPKPLLRRVYQDPMTGGDWEYLRAPTGGIMGVRSKSTLKPIKESDFPLAVRHFEGRRTYRDWMFQHPNASSSSLLVSPMGMGVFPPQPPPVPGAVSTGQGGPLPPASVPTIPAAPPAGTQPLTRV